MVEIRNVQDDLEDRMIRLWHFHTGEFLGDPWGKNQKAFQVRVSSGRNGPFTLALTFARLFPTHGRKEPGACLH